MRYCRRTGLVALLGMLAPCTSALAQETLQVSWQFVETEVLPHPGTHAAAATTYFVIDGKRMTDSNNTTVGLRQTGTGSSGYGVPYSVRYASGHGRLTKTLHLAGTNLRVEVSMLDGDGCSASVRYFKSPGKFYFQTLRVSTHEKVLESDQRAEDVTCSVLRR